MEIVTQFLKGHLAWLPLLGLATFQISQILMSGSIFESLRSFIKKRSAYSFFFNKLEELFSCSLCMSTQVSIWFFTLPSLTIFFWTNSFSLHVVPIMLNVFVLVFLTSMPPAAISYFLFKLLGLLDAKIRSVNNQGADTQSTKVHLEISPGPPPTIDLETFEEWVAEIEGGCDHIVWCGIEKRDCRRATLRRLITQFFREHNYYNPEHTTSYVVCVGEVLQSYFKERKASSSKGYLIQTLWEEMIDDQPLVSQT